MLEKKHNIQRVFGPIQTGDSNAKINNYKATCQYNGKQ
jgi:hypothetical protein